MRTTAGIATITMVLSGCASGLPGLRPLTYQEPAETRLYASYSSCPHRAGDQFAPVFVAAALGVANKLISGFGTALAKGAEGGALPASVSTTNIEVADQPPQCLVIIRGRFSPRRPGEAASSIPEATIGTPIQLNLLKAGSSVTVPVPLPTVYELQHYIEIQIDQSKNKTAMTFGPAIIYIPKSMDGATTGDRALSIAVKFQRPGQDPTGSVVLISNRQIGDKDAYPADPRGRMLYEAPWFAAIEGALPATAGAAASAKGGASAPPPTPGGGGGAAATASAAKPSAPSGGAKPAAKVTPATPNGPIPYTITTTVVETRPTREFLAFVASVFAGIEPNINDAIKGEVDPATKLAAEKTGLDNQASYATTYGNAETALLTYCDLKADTAKSDLITKSAAARAAQINANKAALVAGLAVPYPLLADIGTSDPKASGVCVMR